MLSYYNLSESESSTTSSDDNVSNYKFWFFLAPNEMQQISCSAKAH